MRIRRHIRLIEILERQKDAAARKVALGAEELENAATSAARHQELLETCSLGRNELLRDGLGCWGLREVVLVESAKDLERQALEAEGAARNLAKAESRMTDSSARLARSIALIRVAKGRRK